MNKNMELAKMRGEQLADQEAIGQLFSKIKALYDYLGLMYINNQKKAIKINREVTNINLNKNLLLIQNNLESILRREVMEHNCSDFTELVDKMCQKSLFVIRNILNYTNKTK